MGVVGGKKEKKKNVLIIFYLYIVNDNHCFIFAYWENAII